MKKVQCLVKKSFKDALDNEKEIICNSLYVCSEERAKELSLLGYVKIQEEMDVEENVDETSEQSVESEVTDNVEETKSDDEVTEPTNDNESTESNDDVVEGNEETKSDDEVIETASITKKEKVKNAKK